MRVSCEGLQDLPKGLNLRRDSKPKLRKPFTKISQMKRLQNFSGILSVNQRRENKRNSLFNSQHNSLWWSVRITFKGTDYRQPNKIPDNSTDSLIWMGAIQTPLFKNYRPLVQTKFLFCMIKKGLMRWICLHGITSSVQSSNLPFERDKCINDCVLAFCYTNGIR